MNHPDDTWLIDDLASYFENAEEAKALMMATPEVVFYYDGITGKLTSTRNFLREGLRGPDIMFTIGELVDILTTIRIHFRDYFCFPEETRKMRAARISFEGVAGKTFARWYLETRGTYPSSESTPEEYWDNYLAYQKDFPDAWCLDNYPDKSDDEDAEDCSETGTSAPRPTYNESDVPFSDDSGAEHWESYFGLPE